jgi:hypothetical protein
VRPVEGQDFAPVNIVVDMLAIMIEHEKSNGRIEGVIQQSLPPDLSLPPAGATAGRRSLWPLDHGVMVDLGPRRWEGSAPYFEGFVLNF